MLESVGRSRDIESGLVEHARLGLKRIHTISSPSVQVNGTETSGKENVNEVNQENKLLEYSNANAASKKPPNKIDYISTKKPIEKSIYYQHSKQGMKYWFEEKKPKSYSSKVPMGRKGTLLGLVDAPLK